MDASRIIQMGAEQPRLRAMTSHKWNVFTALVTGGCIRPTPCRACKGKSQNGRFFSPLRSIARSRKQAVRILLSHCK